VKLSTTETQLGVVLQENFLFDWHHSRKRKFFASATQSEEEIHEGVPVSLA